MRKNAVTFWGSHGIIDQRQTDVTNVNNLAMLCHWTDSIPVVYSSQQSAVKFKFKVQEHNIHTVRLWLCALCSMHCKNDADIRLHTGLGIARNLYWRGDSWGPTPKGRNSRPKAGEGSLERGQRAPPRQLGGLGSAISSPSGFRGRALQNSHSPGDSTFVREMTSRLPYLKSTWEWLEILKFN